MSKKIEILIIILLLIAIPIGINFFFTFSKQKENNLSSLPQPSPTKKPANAQTTLTFSPPILNLLAASGSIDILIDTGQNYATAAQLEIMFDPKTIQNVKINAGTFFANPTELLKKIDQTSGKISYAFGASLTGKAQKGKGTLATITFTTLLQKGQNTTISFLPQTIITAENEDQSVLKKTTDATITR